MKKGDFNKLMAEGLKPLAARTYEPDLSLKEIFNVRLDELDLSQKQAQTLLGMEYRGIAGILNRTASRVDVVSLIKLSQFLGITVDDMLSHYYANEMRNETIGQIELAKKHSFIASQFDLTNLRKSKFITGRLTVDEIEKRITKFFGIRDIYEYQKIFSDPAFSRTRGASKDSMRGFWVRSAFVHFKKINNPTAYERDTLVDLMPKIKPYTQDVEQGLLTVVRALYNVGVTVIYQPHLPTVQVHGATFVVDGKPCIVLTDVYKNYPTLWFALLHELHHVLYDYDEISKRTYHLTGEQDLFLIQEDKANSFAREYLFSKENTKYIAALINEEFLVKQYAQENQIHESIIYSFYLHDQKQRGVENAWANVRLKQFIPLSTEAVKDINTNVWEKETIEESINAIKETIFKF